jgi:uncharacterized protein (UPF0276 family)
MDRSAITGVGLGLRWEFLREVLEASSDQLATVSFFEISPENYMRRGGYFPEALARVAEQHAITTHGLTLSLGGDGAFDAEYLRELRCFLGRFGAPWHSDHLSFCGLDGVHLHDLLPLPFTSISARRVAERTREAAERLERRMVVENISYYLTLGHSELDEPAFIAEVLDRAGCGLLLDVNNLDVNARNHGFDPLQWLRAIPLEQVVEIHVAGPEPLADGLLIDTHGAPVQPSVYELLDWVVERTGPLPVLLERDNNIPPLDELLLELTRIDAVYQAALARREASREASHAA